MLRRIGLAARARSYWRGGFLTPRWMPGCWSWCRLEQSSGSSPSPGWAWNASSSAALRTDALPVHRAVLSRYDCSGARARAGCRSGRPIRMAGSRRLHYPRQQDDMVGDGARAEEVLVDSKYQYRAPRPFGHALSLMPLANVAWCNSWDLSGCREALVLHGEVAIRPAWTTAHSTYRGKRSRSRISSTVLSIDVTALQTRASISGVDTRGTHAPRQRRSPSRTPHPQTESARDGFVNGLAKRRIRKPPPLERAPIKWNRLIDKDAAQNQIVGACRNRKSSATLLRTCSQGSLAYAAWVFARAGGWTAASRVPSHAPWARPFPRHKAPLDPTKCVNPVAVCKEAIVS
jgi:hypothetical protein